MPILNERVGSTEVITLSNDGAFNAITHDEAPQIAGLIDEAVADRGCRAVVLTGEGTKAFCAGIDVKSVAARDAAASGDSNVDQPDPMMAQFDGLHRVLGSAIRAIHGAPLPVICAINGHAIGAGFAMAAASDLRIAGTGAKFADGFIGRGISGCELGLSYFLPKTLGTSLAFELMVTGRRMMADEAKGAGFVSRVVEPESVLETALELAEQVAANAPAGVAMTKETMWANLHSGSLDQALALESRTQVMVRNTADAAEARAAFIEKRPPVFRG